MSDFEVDITPAPAINVSVSGGIGPAGPAGAGGVTTLQGLAGALTLAAVGGSWATSGSTITLTVTAAGSVAWADITGKPSTFAPSAHTHAIADVTGLQTALDGKQAAGSYAAASHAHTASAITDFSTAALAAVTWSTLTGKPSFATVATSGAYSDLTGLPSAYSLPTASATVLGGIKIGSGLTIDGSGVVTAAGTYTLPAATISTLGGVIVGTGLAVSSGTVSVSYGSSSTTACVGNDSRLSDARTPTAHTQAWSTITSTPTTLSGYGIADGQKTITSGTAAPSGGSNGDIYLRYS